MNPFARQAKPAVEKVVFYTSRMDCKNWYTLLRSCGMGRGIGAWQEGGMKERVSVYRLHVRH